MFEQRLLAVDRRERGPDQRGRRPATAPSGGARHRVDRHRRLEHGPPDLRGRGRGLQGRQRRRRLSVKESGTGGGFTKFCAGETDINDASRPIKADDAKEGAACKTNGITYVQLQVAIDGLTVVVNPANTFATCMTLEQLKRSTDRSRPRT